MFFKSRKKEPTMTLNNEAQLEMFPEEKVNEVVTNNTVVPLTDMRSEVIMVTPDLAKVFLASNTSNRNIRKGVVSSYAKAMSRGEWKLSPQGVTIYTKTNRILDGQHRLLAVVQSGVTVPLFVVYTSDEEVFKVLDQGARRNTGDLFNLDKRVADTVNFCSRLMMNSFGSLSSAQLEPVINSSLGKMSGELIEFCGINRKGFSSSPVKAAVVTSVLFGTDKDYAFNLYRNLILMDFDNLPPVGKAFLRQLNTGSIDFSKSNGSKNTYARSLKLFNEGNKNLNVIRISNEVLSSTISKTAKKMKVMLIQEGSIEKDWGK